MRLTRCNRCGAEQELTQIQAEDNAVVRMTQALGGMKNLAGWAQLKLSPFGILKPPVQTFDLCEDCVEIFHLQFLTGARIEAITKPAEQTTLPHENQLYQDCLLAFDPERGGLICEHDDPERFLKLQTDRVQNVAEGVPEQPIQEAVRQLVSDVHTAAYAQALPQRCSSDCSEQHTYGPGCLLDNVVQPPEPMTAIGRLAQELANDHQIQCPDCSETGMASSLRRHMLETHNKVPGKGVLEGQWVPTEVQGGVEE